MGFDKHVQDDNCYWDDPADVVGMNVEIIEDNGQVMNNVQVTSNLDISGSSHSNINGMNEVRNECSKKIIIRKAHVCLSYCTEHKDMALYEDEKLVKPGDKFKSHDAFIQYLNENAKRWCFYYKCSDSHKPNTENETYTYSCVYLKNKDKYKNKGIRMRNKNLKTDCPCKIKLRRLQNENELTVVYVCNHHDHELSLQEFYKLQHGRRLPPHVKEEILDLLALKVDVMKIKAYVELETGFSMSRSFFYALDKNMRSTIEKRNISEDWLRIYEEKIAAADIMFSHKYNDEINIDSKTQHQKNKGDAPETTKKTKQILNNIDTTKNIPSKIRRSKTKDEVTSSDDIKRIKLEECSEITYNNERLESVNHLQDSLNCEILINPWVSDQCVPVIPNRTATTSDCEQYAILQTMEPSNNAHSDAQNGSLSYTIQYYNEDGSHEIINNKIYREINNEEGTNKNEESGINMAYETVVTNDQDEARNEMLENDNQNIHDSVEYHIEEDQSEDHNETAVNSNAVNTGELGENLEYTMEEDGVQYVDDSINENQLDVSVQTADNTSSHSLLPVFDVYMQDGNVTGFVVNKNLISGLKDGVDKSIQTSEDVLFSDAQDMATEDFDCEIIHDTTSSEGTYTKNEYVHKYNIDKYMVQPRFPKYVEILAKETCVDVLHMFANVYNEKAMFKITTTHKGKEGDTRIWYITDIPKSFMRRRRYLATNEKLTRQRFNDLKRRLRSLKKQNKELVLKNNLLEEVALKLVDKVD